MKTIILAGGLGTRLSEETDSKPKPMVLIGDKPMLWHIMEIYALNGFDEFVIATGYKHRIIEEWVAQLDTSWKIECVFTGEDTQTGGRIRQCMELIDEELCFITYGDGLANVDIKELLRFHQAHGKLATVTAVHPPARFGVLELEGEEVLEFSEKDRHTLGWINGGFFVVDKKVKDLIASNFDPFETGALPKLAIEKQLMAYRHTGFWQPMDTLREKRDLEALALQDSKPWIHFK
jgi:glucose-1-phosphate cytidylyltransferase